MIVEHIDGDGLNNKLYNLRLVSKEVNGRNKSKRYNNKTGLMGIHIEQGTGYRASASIPNIGQKSKYFSFLKYGKEEALRLAIEWRTAKLKELNEQGAGYTDRHINQG
jgi:hypothetical protein